MLVFAEEELGRSRPSDSHHQPPDFGMNPSLFQQLYQNLLYYYSIKVCIVSLIWNAEGRRQLVDSPKQLLFYVVENSRSNHTFLSFHLVQSNRNVSIGLGAISFKHMHLCASWPPGLIYQRKSSEPPPFGSYGPESNPVILFLSRSASSTETTTPIQSLGPPEFIF